MTVRTRLIGGVVLGLAATGAGPAWSAPPAPAAVPASPAAVVQLITGDIVELPTAERPAVAMLPRVPARHRGLVPHRPEQRRYVPRTPHRAPAR
jgi:hypothetical protein